MSQESEDIMDVDASFVEDQGKKSRKLIEEAASKATGAGSTNNDFADRRSSINQELRCPICLTEMEDATMLSDCLHTFCYNCILEWLKMKPECPLCKRVPKFFKHKFCLTHSGEKPTWDTPAQRSNVVEMRAASEMESIMLRTSYTADVERHAVMQVVQRLEEEIRMLQHMSYRTYARSNYYKTIIKEAQDELLIYENLLNMFAVLSRREIFNQESFRRVVYLRNLSPRSIVTPQFGVVFNADYVKSHESTVRAQLMPYILREYSAITRQTAVDVDELMKVIFDYLMNKINRLETVSYLKNRRICHPHQFLNNLAHFAGTGQTLSVYDQNSEYTPRGSNVLPYIDGSDDILVLNSAVNNDVQVVGETSSSGGAASRPPPPPGFTSRPSRNMLDRFTQRLTELQNRVRDVDNGTSGLNSFSSRRSRRPAGNNDGSVVVNIGDSSSDSSVNVSDDDEIAAIELSPPRSALNMGGGGGETGSIPVVAIGGRDNITNVTRLYLRNGPFASSISNSTTTATSSGPSYVYTPSTNDWRRNHTPSAQLERLLTESPLTSSSSSFLMGGSSRPFGAGLSSLLSGPLFSTTFRSVPFGTDSSAISSGTTSNGAPILINLSATNNTSDNVSSTSSGFGLTPTGAVKRKALRNPPEAEFLSDDDDVQGEDSRESLSDSSIQRAQRRVARGGGDQNGGAASHRHTDGNANDVLDVSDLDESIEVVGETKRKRGGGKSKDKELPTTRQ